MKMMPILSAIEVGVMTTTNSYLILILLMKIMNPHEA